MKKLVVTLSGAAAVAVMTAVYAGGDHGAHGDEKGGHSGGHMEHMETVRNGLKKELGAGYDTKIPLGTPAQIKSGKEIFARSCTVCHGPGGKGDGPAASALPSKPADFTDATHAFYYSDAARLHIIANGIKGTAMAGWKGGLKEHEIKDVHAYITSLRDAAPAKGSHHKGSGSKKTDGHKHAH